jgi:hypothetical protein
VTITKGSLAINVAIMFLACCLSPLFGAGQVFPSKETVIALTASLERKGDTTLILRFKLTNIGPSALSIPFGHLPWHRYAMSIAVVQNDPDSTAIKQRAVVADPPPAEPHRILKGETFEGEIDLADRFPGVIEKLNRGDLIVFWSYQCPAEGASVERVAGSLVIPQTKR